ncbi:TATA box-binding protein-associated factor, RNA polymerase I, subunit C [Brachyhypopomus gauderio]|uniref:TATA box-binding protein-associated factor, RNA polymerase I, subunit C n=1 Tax=Brachyhypopomus gauderio TaxID=698409 RepID=UPI004043110C
MDNKFPRQLFPHWYFNGPPDLKPVHDYGSWGSYGAVVETRDARGGPEEGNRLQFQSQRRVEGETWIPTEPIVTPLLPPNKDSKINYNPSPNPDDFPEHMQYFFVHHCMDSFYTMGHLLSEHFNFNNKGPKNSIKMNRMKDFLSSLNYKKCEFGHYSTRVCRYRRLLGDVVSDIPMSLLGEYLHEELTYQRELERFQQVATGGALAYVSLEDDQKEACLIYPTGEVHNSLVFHHVVQEFCEEKPPSMHLASTPMEFDVNGTVRQVSANTMTGEAHIGVRSDHFCSSWVIKEGQRPRVVEVVQLKERSTSLNVSPHIAGEVLVASESGAAYLWTVGMGLQKFREEDSNLYFNAKSPWRWCEFSAHPRVMVYADRTGAELTDSRSSDCSHTLFRIGNTAQCRNGERVILTKYLEQSHAHHHLVTTQFSAYVMDERMPCIPALRWDHMLESPPCFAHVLPGLGPGGTSKLLLGAQRAQETVLLQYSGGREWACRSDGPVQKLSSPSESLPIRQLPHRQHQARQRLALPATGLAAKQDGSFLTVFQLTEAGDIFYQLLKLHPDTIDTDLDPPRPEQLSDSDFERERSLLSPVQVVVNGDADCSPTPDSSGGTHIEPTFVPESSAQSSRVNCTHLVRPKGPETASSELKQIWKQWLESLLTRTVAKKRCLKHRQVKTKNLVRFNVRRRDKLEKEKLLSLSKVLLDVMKNRQVLVHGVTNLPDLKVTTFEDAVHPNDWADDLSNRMTASWGGSWGNWWEEKLGLNRDAKIQALRRKRRLQKQARAQSRVSLSGSFTSSIGYQDDLSGWSSGTSQYMVSDGESFVSSRSAPEDDSLSEPDMLVKIKSPELSLHMTEQSKDSLRRPQLRPEGSSQDRASSISQFQPSLTSPRSQHHLIVQASTSSTIEPDAASSQSILKSSGLPQQNPKWRPDYLGSPFASQELFQDFGQDDLNDDAAATSQRSGFSQALRGPSQVRTSSQASQPQRKKSRMGF